MSEPCGRRLGVHDVLDHDGERSSSCVQRREVRRELLGEHRKDAAPPCRPTSCSARARSSSGVPFFTSASTSAIATRTFTAPPGSGSATESWSRSRRVVVVDRGPEQGPQVAQPVPHRWRRGRDRVELLESALREIRRQSPFPHRPPGDLVEVGAVAAGPVVHATILTWAAGRNGPRRRTAGTPNGSRLLLSSSFSYRTKPTSFTTDRRKRLQTRRGLFRLTPNLRPSRRPGCPSEESGRSIEGVFPEGERCLETTARSRPTRCRSTAPGSFRSRYLPPRGPSGTGKS